MKNGPLHSSSIDSTHFDQTKRVLRVMRKMLYKHFSISKNCRNQNSDIPRAGRCGAAHGETKKSGGNEQHMTPTGLFAQKKIALLHPRRRNNDLLGVSLEARTKETQFKTMVEPRYRLIRDGQPIHPRFSTKTRSVFRFLDVDELPMPIRLFLFMQDMFLNPSNL